MRKLVKRIFYSLSALALMLVALYLSVPVIAKWQIAERLPNGFSIEAIDIPYGTFDSFWIRNLIIRDEFNNQITVSDLKLSFSIFELAVKKISIGQVNLDIPEVDSLRLINNSASNASSSTSFNLPFLLAIDQITGKTRYNNTEFQVQGQANFNGDKNQLSLDVSSSVGARGTLKLNQTDIENLDVYFETVQLPINLLSPFYRNLLSEHNTSLSGLIDVKIEDTFRLNDIYDFNLKELIVDLKISELAIEHPQGMLTSPLLSAKIKKTPNDLTVNTSLISNITLAKALTFSKKTNFKVAMNDAFISLNTDRVTFIFPIFIDDQIEVNSKGTYFLNSKEINSNHQFASKEISSVSLPVDFLKSYSAENIHGQFELSGSTDAPEVIQISNTQVKGQKLKLSYQDIDFNSQLFSITLRPFDLSLRDINGSYSFDISNLILNQYATNIPGVQKGKFSRSKAITSIENRTTAPKDRMSSDYSTFVIDGRQTMTINQTKKQWRVGVQGETKLYKPKPLIRTQLMNAKWLKQITFNAPIITSLDFKLSFENDVINSLVTKTSSTLANWSFADSQIYNSQLMLDSLDNETWDTLKFKFMTLARLKGSDNQEHEIIGTVKMFPIIKLKDIDIDSTIFEGRLSGYTSPEWQEIDQLSGTLSLSNLELKNLVEFIQPEDLNAKGKVTGNLPFFMVDGYPQIKNGQLSSTGGVIEYVPGGVKQQLTKDNVSDIATIALQNFHYSSMQVNLIENTPCEFNIKLRLEGNNPDMGSKQAQIFNINYQPKSNVNLYYLMLLGADNLKNIENDKLHSGCVN